MTVQVAPGSSKRIPIDFNVSDAPKKLLVQDSFDSSSSIPIVINPKVYKGYSQHKSKSLSLIQTETDSQTVQKISLSLPSEIIDNKVKVEVNYQPYGPALLLSSIKELVREPTGCFEQTSSKTFPMVLLMQYFQSQPQLFDPKHTDKKRLPS